MSRVSRSLRSELLYAAAAANAWLRGLSIPAVALHYRYEPITALHLIRRCSDEYGEVNVRPWVPDLVLSVSRLICQMPSVPTLVAGSGEDGKEAETL